MKKSAIMVLFISISLFAQITVTQQDLISSYGDITVTEYGTTHAFTTPINLGTAASTAQSFDFSNLFTFTTMDTSYATHQAVNGQPGAVYFPEATRVSQQDYIFPQFSYHLYIYYSITDQGICIEGMANNQIVPGVLDTVYYQGISPYFLTYPVPFTLNSTKTHIDTTTANETGDYSIEENSWECNGFGEMKLPDGNTYQVLRVINTELERDYEEGVLVNMETSKEVQFWTREGNMLTFDVDTTYTGGNTLPEGFHLSMTGGVTSVRFTNDVIPAKLILEQNYPNPFNPSTTIGFTLPEPGNVTLKVYNMLGEEVNLLVNENFNSGTHRITFNADNLKSGVYLYKIEFGGSAKCKKMLIIK